MSNRKESWQEFWNSWKEAGKPPLIVFGLKYQDDDEPPEVEIWEANQPEMKTTIKLDELVMEYWKAHQRPGNLM